MDNKTENIISTINTNIFFKEFTFSKNNFKALDSKQQLEFADNVVWLDDLLFIYQIKERGYDNSSDDQKWYQNKVINKGVKQIKSTLSYLMSFSEINIQNEKGHKLNISQARNCNPIRKIIIYSPSNNFPEGLRSMRFYESSEVGLIHLFHIEDYYWVCKYLLTPAEIDEYFGFREDYYCVNPKRSNLLTEQYMLAHFFETLKTDHYEPKYIDNFKKIKNDKNKFDISLLIRNFSENIKLINHQTEYYPIIREISKLNRSELYEFKRRFTISKEMSEKEDIVPPYRMYVPRTDCAFIFIPMHHSKSSLWKNALTNFSLIHKYDNKASKCVGMIIFRDSQNLEYFELYWAYVESYWVYDPEIESLLKNNPLFRKTN